MGLGMKIRVGIWICRNGGMKMDRYFGGFLFMNRILIS